MGMDDSVSAVERARSGLARMIAAGELQAGELLPPESVLCERFEVSRSSLREAQKMLTVAGVLTPRPGSRSAVSDMSAGQIMRGLQMVLPLLPLDRYLELFTLREVLEGHVAAQAAARMSEADRELLVQLEAQLASAEPSDEAQRLDAEFHGLIIHSAGDEMIASLLETIRRRGRDYRIFEEEAHAELKQVSDHAHGEITAAILARDPETARFLAMQHVRVTRSWLEGIRPGPILFEGGPGAPVE